MDYQEYLDQYVSYDPVLARRCWACVVDYVIYYVLLIIYGYFFGKINDWGFQDGSFSMNVKTGPIPMFFIWLLYFPIIESVLGYTLGKGLFDLKVIRERKADFPFFVSLKRHMLDFIDFFFFGIVGILLVKYSKSHKRLGDLWAHTIVIREGSQPPAHNTL